MLFLLLLAVVSFAVWAMAFGRTMIQAGKFRVSFLLVGFAVLVTGSVFGFDFFKIDKGPLPLTLDRMLLGAMAGIFGMLILRKKIVLRPLDTTDLLICLLLGMIVISVATNDWSFRGNRPISRLLFFYLLPALLYFVVKNSSFSDFDLKLVAIGFAGFGLYLGLTAIAESRGWYGLVFPTYIRDETVQEFFGRGRGPYLNPVSNGIYLTICLAAGMVAWWHTSGKLKLVLTCILPILFVGAIATLTRSVWVGAAAACGLVVWLPANRRQRAAMFVAAICIGCVGFFALGDSVLKFKRDKHVTENQMSKSAQLRPIFLAIAIDMFQDYPFTGCGFGHYARVRMNYLQTPNSPYELRKGAEYLQHNVFLAFLTETGLIGLILIVLLLFKSFVVSWSLWCNQAASSLSRSYALLMIAFLVTYLINGMFHDVSIVPMANYLLFFLLAVTANRHAFYMAAAATQKDVAAVRSCGMVLASGNQ